MRLLHARQLNVLVGSDPGGVTEIASTGVGRLGVRSLQTRQVNDGVVRGDETVTGAGRGAGFTGAGGTGERIVQTFQPLLNVVVGAGAGRGGGGTGIGFRNETGAGRGGGRGAGRGSGAGAGRGGLTTGVVPGTRTVQPLLGPFGPGLNSRHPQGFAM